MYGKRDEISKIWANFRVLRCGIGIPRSNVGPRQGVACPHLNVAKKEVWTASGTPRRSKSMPRQRPMPQRRSATPQLSYCSHCVDFCVLFCFAILLFRGLVYWTNEDPISV